ncbi:hypothetical protein DW712_24255, partial [Bacteroides intestinalis]
SFQKADAKVRTFKYILQMFSEVFFLFSFSRRLSLRKGDKRRRKMFLAPFLSASQFQGFPSLGKRVQK